MRSNIVSTIYKKELREVLRDKRMIYLVILMPFFIYPVLFTILGKVGASQAEKISSERITVLLNPEAAGTPVHELLREDPTLDVRLQAFTRDEVDTMRNTIGLQVPADFAQRLSQNGASTITVYSDDTRDAVEQRKGLIVARLRALGQQITNERLTQANLEPDFIQPIQITEEDLATRGEAAGRVLGSMLPALILLFIFIGCIYIAIDITAGEKERRTLQTLFTAPVSTSEIIAGKFLAVATVGMVSAAANLLSLLVSMYIQISLMGADVSDMSLALAPASMVWFILLVILATIFLAALSLGVVLLANTYKEAQSYVSPLMMLVLIPAFVSGMPGMELNTSTAMIPMLNISLALASILKGEAQLTMLAMVAGFALLYGVIGLWLASKTFGNENVVTGEKVDFKALFR